MNRRIWQSLIAVLAGNAIYFSTERYLPSRDSDRPSNHVDGRSRQSNGARNGGRWEPHVADRIFKQMMAAAPSVRVFYRQYATGVLKRGNRVAGVISCVWRPPPF